MFLNQNSMDFLNSDHEVAADPRDVDWLRADLHTRIDQAFDKIIETAGDNDDVRSLVFRARLSCQFQARELITFSPAVSKVIEEISMNFRRKPSRLASHILGILIDRVGKGPVSIEEIIQRFKSSEFVVHAILCKLSMNLPRDCDYKFELTEDTAELRKKSRE